MSKIRVLYILHHFPQVSETYIRSEIEAVQQEYELRVISLNRADAPYREHAPFALTDDPYAIREIIEEFRPDVLHTHWLTQVPTLAYFSGYLAGSLQSRQIPFTVRAHSFDVLDADQAALSRIVPVLNSDYCLGVLTFPFGRPILEKSGVRSEKLRDCFPVVNFGRFHDRSPNGEGIMNVGACLPKKQMQDFLELARLVPSRSFHLYAMGYRVAEMQQMNEAAGGVVRIVPPVEPQDMPCEFKKHAWLVYTAAHSYNTVGWPLSIAEAQAAGLGVCLPNLRPDLREYVGEGGILYNSIREVAEMIARPPSEEQREAGFAQAEKSDVNRHKRLLTELWDGASGAPLANGSGRREPLAGYAWGDWPANWEWKERAYSASREAAPALSHGSSYILVDEGQLGRLPGLDARPIPFTEHDGQYWGPPTDDEAAIAETERLRQAGARALVVAWPAFWWADHFAGWHQHLIQRYRCPVRTDNVVVFDLYG